MPAAFVGRLSQHIKNLAIPWNIVENRLHEISAFGKGEERLVLYEIVLEELQ